MNDADAEIAPELRQFWSTRILEIRKSMADKADFLLNWFRRPEDLIELDPERQPYHGRYELIPSDAVDMIHESIVFDAY